MSEFDPNKQTIEQYDGDCTCDPTSIGYATCEFCHDRNVIRKLRIENERLRSLLKYCQPYFETRWERIEKELNDD